MVRLPGRLSPAPNVAPTGPGLAARAGSRSWSRSSVPRPPTANGGPPSGWSARFARARRPRRGSRPSPRMAPTGGRSGSAPCSAPSAASPRCAAGACSGPCSARSAPAGIAADFPPGKRPLRRLLPRRTAYNVALRARPGRRRADGGRSSPTTTPPTPGLVFHPALPLLADRLGLIESTDTSPPLMAPVLGGPVLAALGALTGRRLLARLGVLLGLGSAAAMADIGLRGVVPGANDNGSGVVALLAARRGGWSPSRPRTVRVILLSAGAEESFSEGIKAFGERHFAELPAREHLLPLPRVGRLAAPAGPARRGLPEDARVPAAGAGADGRRSPRSSASGSTPTCALTTAPTASSRWRPATRPPSLCGCTDLKQPGQLPLAQRPRRERRVRHRRRRRSA